MGNLLDPDPIPQFPGGRVTLQIHPTANQTLNKQDTDQEKKVVSSSQSATTNNIILPEISATNQSCDQIIKATTT